MTPVQHDARVARALAVLALTLPALTGISLAEDAPPQATTPATSPTQVVGEQVGTAREIVPFGAAVVTSPAGSSPAGTSPEEPGTTGGADAGSSAMVVWAVGQTRGPTAEPPSTPTTPRVADRGDQMLPPSTTSTTPDGDGEDEEGGGKNPKGTTPDEQVLPPLPGIPAPTTATTPTETTPEDTTPPKRPVDVIPQPSTPPVNVLLTGTAAGPDAPTAWKRTELPLDANGDPLAAGSWRPAGSAVHRESPPAAPNEPQRAANASPNAGDATVHGAAALLVRVADPAPSAGVLARRSDGRFQLLPGVPAELLAPAERIADPDATTDLAPMAVIDLPDAKPAPTTPDGAAEPPQVPPYGRTGVLLVPAGGDGVLAWDGNAWSEEPFQDAAGQPAAPASTPVALAATPDGDAVALVASDDTAPDRVTLYRRLADHSGWRPMKLESPLLSGPLPAGIEAVRPTVRRGEGQAGDPLTAAPGHWWIDVLVRRSGGATVPATIHLRPGPARVSTVEPTTPEQTDPAATTPTPTDPAETTGPAPTDPAATEPAPTTTPVQTNPDAAPSDPLSARATGTFCVAATPTADATKALDDDGKLCTHELPAGFPASRGYRSQAFATQGALATGAAAAQPSAPGAADSRFGGRIITSPVTEQKADGPAARDRSASGGYLRLVGDRFTLEGGLGETPDGTGHTETAAFVSDIAGWTGGSRLAARVMRAAAVDAGTYRTTTPPMWEGPIDVALSPDDMAKADTGSVVLTPTAMRREFDDDRDPTWGWTSELWDYDDDEGRALRAIAWLPGDRLAIVGTNGAFYGVDSPRPEATRVQFDFSNVDLEISRVKGAEGLDLVDVAARPIDPFTEPVVGISDEPSGAGQIGAGGPTEPGNGLGKPRDGADFEGWAVGRDGAALRFRGFRAIRRVPLEGVLEQADLRQVAYADKQAYIASSAGLLKASGDEIEIDRELAAMIEADGRPPEVRTVAGLADGAVVVDARYVRNGPDSPWERLASPAEGDVVAVALARPGATPAQGTKSLRIYASIADVGRPRIGEIDRQIVEIDRNNQPVYHDFESTAVASDGRLAELTPAGWIDRTRTPLERTSSIDVTQRPLPIQSIVTDPSGRGWAVGGEGSYIERDGRLVEKRGTSIRIDDTQLAVAPPWPTAVRPTTPATAPDQVAASTPDQAAAAAPAPAASTPIPDPAPDAKRIKILIGGHPACAETCTGREDQRVAPLANLQLALAAGARLRAKGVQAVVIGGGRTTAATDLSRAAAQGYADLLRSEPGGPPAFAALGTGDAGRGADAAVKRATFVQQVIDPLKPADAASAAPGAPRLVDVTVPGSDARDAEAAYAFDVPGQDGGAARVVVIDNTTDEPLRGGLSGPQGKWLEAVLDDAAAQRRAVVVVGAAAIDRAGLAADQAQLLKLLLDHGVAAYVSTDGEDDRQSEQFGPRERTRTLKVDDRRLLLVHSSTLGHALPSPVWMSLRDSLYRDDDEVETGPLSDYREAGASLVQLSLPALAGAGSVSAESVSVVRRVEPAEVTDFAVGAAMPLWVPVREDSENGIRWVDPSDKKAGEQVTAGSGISTGIESLCGVLIDLSECARGLPPEGRFSVEDPSIAMFVRAKVKTKRVKGKVQQDGDPEVVTDPATGNPIADGASQILCPIKAGTTWATFTAGGLSARWRLRIVPRPDGMPGPEGKNKCDFLWTHRHDDPVPAKPATPAIPPAVVIPPVPVLEPGPAETKSKPHHKTAKTLTPRTPLLLAPVDVMSTAVPPSAVPPVSPKPKPITPPPGPAPAPVASQSHIYSQLASPVTAAQAITVLQTERRHEVAREGADHQAVAYEADPLPTVRLLLAGGALALLTALGGALAGRRRALARAAARRYLR